MFEYEKLILQKVSFSNELFKKELTKSIASLHKDELGKFKDWVFYNFYHTHYNEISVIFNPILEVDDCSMKNDSKLGIVYK